MYCDSTVEWWENLENSSLCSIECNLSIISFRVYEVTIIRFDWTDSYWHLFFFSSGQGLVYYIDELTGSLQLAYKIQLSVENFPG